MTDNQKIFNYLHKGDDKACWHEEGETIIFDSTDGGGE